MQFIPIISKANTILCLMPGMAEKDAGTSAADGTAEKDINLGIVLNLYDFSHVLRG